EETGLDFDPKSPDLDGTLAKLGTIANIIGATLRDTANPTMLSAGYKANVIPQTAEAVVDCRILPGRQAEFEATVDELIGPDVQREWITKLDSYETTFDGHLVDAMNDAILAHDPGARTVPYALFHGVDERVPVDALLFGTRVLEHFLLHS
uniref:peptidase dimerization domain-containing protein n=1 Tax=Rhodococcus opacus TaxID=37919 RepID=UPI000AF548F5